MANKDRDAKQKGTKRQNIATILSIIPGLGQIYNRRYLKGILLFVIAVSFLITFWEFIDIGIWGIFTLGTIPRDHHSMQLLIQELMSLIVWSFGIAIYDYYVSDGRNDDKTCG